MGALLQEQAQGSFVESECIDDALPPCPTRPAVPAAASLSEVPPHPTPPHPTARALTVLSYESPLLCIGSSVHHCAVQIWRITEID